MFILYFWPVLQTMIAFKNKMTNWMNERKNENIDKMYRSRTEITHNSPFALTNLSEGTATYK